MSQSERAPSAGRDQRYVLTTGVVERPVAERPTNDSLDVIAEWLVGAAREIPSGLHAFDEFAWRMLATGLPLLRVTLHSGTLHPQFLGTTLIWWRTSGQSEQTLIAHEITDLIRYEDNPVQRVCIGGETLRRRLDVPDETFDFAVLRELKAQHATDYLALPIRSVHGRNHYYMVTYVTDRPGGFTADEIADMTRVSQRLGVVCDIQGLWWVATNVLNAYLGPKTGPRVLAGQIRRGTGGGTHGCPLVLGLARVHRAFGSAPGRSNDRHPQCAVRCAGEGYPRPWWRDLEIHRRRSACDLPDRGQRHGRPSRSKCTRGGTGSTCGRSPPQRRAVNGGRTAP